jgi:hypothetical protein
MRWFKNKRGLYRHNCMGDIEEKKVEVKKNG